MTTFDRSKFHSNPLTWEEIAETFSPSYVGPDIYGEFWQRGEDVTYLVHENHKTLDEVETAFLEWDTDFYYDI